MTLLRPTPNDRAAELLFLDRVPLARDAWSVDEFERVVTWHGAYGGGRLWLPPGHRSGAGLMGEVGAEVGIYTQYRTAFVCEVAKDAGARTKLDGERVVGLAWDASSEAWKKAAWGGNVLRFQFTYDTAGDPTEQDTSGFTYTDLR